MIFVNKIFKLKRRGNFIIPFYSHSLKISNFKFRRMKFFYPLYIYDNVFTYYVNKKAYKKYVKLYTYIMYILYIHI